MSNLMESIVKFTERGEITIRAELEKKLGRQSPIDSGLPATFVHITGRTSHVVSMRFSFSDTGIAIAPDARTQNFQPVM